jgi:Ca2+/Na+ antiporter
VTGLRRYYVVRILISAAFGGLLYLGGLPWWLALMTMVFLIVLFLWLPRSGRYVVNHRGGAEVLHRDERSQTITHRAGSIAFAVIMIAIGTLAIYYGIIRPASVPVNWLNLVVALGALSYFLADIWLRRK